MNEILSRIEESVGKDNLAKSCKEKNCRASMKNVSRDRVVVDANKAFKAHNIGGSRCDCILFYTGSDKGLLFTVPIELKSGDVDVSEALEQLRAGAKFVNRFVSTTVNSTCRPILFHAKGLHPNQRKKLNRSKIRFRGINLTIKTAHCCESENLANALSE